LAFGVRRSPFAVHRSAFTGGTLSDRV